MKLSKSSKRYRAVVSNLAKARRARLAKARTQRARAGPSLNGRSGVDEAVASLKAALKAEVRRELLAALGE